MGMMFAGVTLWAEVDIRYVGPSGMHCGYWIPVTGSPTELKVEVEGPEGNTVIAEAGGEATDISGICQTTSLSPGYHTCLTKTRTYNAETESWSDWGTVDAVPFRVDGTTAAGFLLFDETLADAVPENIFVSDGITLTLTGTLTASTNANAAIMVMPGGTLAAEPGLVLLPRQGNGAPDIPVKIQLAQPHSFSEIQGGYFVLFGSGSTFENCRDIRFAPYADTSLTDITNGVVDLSSLGSGGTLTAENCTLCSGTSGNGKCNNGTAVLKSVVWTSGFEVDGQASVQADQVDFKGSVTVGDANHSPVGEEAFHATNCRFGKFYVSRAAAGAVTLADSLFAGDVTVFSGAPAFLQCEFGGKVRLQDRSAAILQRSRFLDELLFLNTWDSSHFFTDVPRWYEDASPSPTISGNAFMGDSALRYDRNSVFERKFPSSPIMVGANYYGSKHGYFYDYEGAVGDARGFLPGAYRARVHGNDDSVTFLIQTQLEASPLPAKRRDSRVFPAFWLNGHIAGQNTIDHGSGTFDTSASRILLKGRETLLSLDLSCTEEEVDGVRVYAEWNGQKIEALPFSKGRVRRDPATFTPAEIRSGRAICSFVLPGVTADSMPFSVFLDASKVSGFEPEAYPQTDQCLLQGTLSFKDPPQKTLNIWVLPVKVSATVTSWGPADPSGVAELLKRSIPDMLPLPEEKLRVETRPCATVWSPLTIVTSLGMLNRVSGMLAVNRWLMSGNTNNAPDLIVVVMPNGIISCKSDGVSFVGRRRVLFVDEYRPTAGMHELGHAIGLCTDTEEYHDYPPNGIEVECVTQFATAKRGGLRIEHIPGKHHDWYDPQCPRFDIMGAVEPSLPLPGLMNVFYTWFCENLRVPAVENALPQPFSLKGVGTSVRTLELPAAGTRRILVSGATDRYCRFLPETVSLFDVTPTGRSALPPGSGTAYRFEAYDGANTLLSAQAFTPEQETAEWMATFDIPSETVSSRIVDAYDGSVAKRVTACGLESAVLQVPAQGAVIGQTLEVRWRVSSTATPTPDQVRHLLYYRAGGSDEWQLLAGPTAGTNLVASSNVLPEGGPLTFKLVSSDGLSSVESTVDGLTVSPRAPLVTIRSPSPNEQGVTNAVWQLTADVVEFPVGSVTGGVWTSSLQGVLGQGLRLNTELKPGEHRLRYEAAASNGLTGAAEVTVLVAPSLAATDLGFLSADLTLGTSYADPNGLTLTYLVKNVTNSFNLFLRNRGADVTGRLRLYLRVPDSEETLAATYAVKAAPFETQQVALRVFVDRAGAYTLRAVFDEVSPTDTDLSNNERQWTYTSVIPRITLVKNPDNCGTVTGGGLYLDGAKATVCAQPRDDYVFVNWTEGGTVVSTNAEYSFTAAVDRTLTANFRPLVAVISLSAVPSAGGSVTGDGTYSIGSDVTVSATPNSGYRFVSWTARDAEFNQVEVSTNATYVFTVVDDRMLRANFAPSGSGGEMDPPLASAGSYDGFLSGENAVGERMVSAVRGTVSLRVSGVKGLLSAKAVVQTGSLSFSAKTWLTAEGDGTLRATLVARSGETLDLSVRQQRMWGTLKNGILGEQVLSLDGARNRFAERTDAQAQALLAGFKGYYTVSLPACEILSLGEAQAAPRGTGYLAVTVGSGGSAKIAGIMADGTSLSQSSRLILADGNGPGAFVPFFAPLYLRKGWAGGLLWIVPGTRAVVTDHDNGWCVRWEKPGAGPDGFSELLDACGGWYGTVPALANDYLFGADVLNVPYHFTGGVADVVAEALPAWLGVTVAGSRMTMVKGSRPVKGADGAYLYAGENCSLATLSFTARTGVFKGNFSLYYDYELNGKPQHRTVRVPYVGILTPVRDEAFAELPDGMGHCLVPDNDPAMKDYRLKRSFPVSLDASE